MKKTILEWIEERLTIPQPLMAASQGSVFSFAMGGGQKPSKPTVRVERRRPGDTGTASSRPRADTPSRDRPGTSGGSSGGFSGGSSSGSSGGFSGGGSSGGFSSGGSSDSSGGFSSGGSSGGGAGLIGALLSMLLSGGAGTRSGGKRRPSILLIIILLALAACCIFFIIPQLGSFLSDAGGLTTGDNTYVEPTSNQTYVEQPTSAPVGVLPTLESSTAGGDTWLVMMYQDADDQVLEKDIFIDMNEAERVGSTDKVKVVAQLDRYRGAFSGDGNWTSAKRFYITRDGDLNQISSQMVQDLGEVNMSDGQTLIDFVTWAMAAYPADKYALILSDHGAGWPGGWSDPTSTTPTVRNLPLSGAMGDQLYLMEIDQALGAIRQQTGLDKFEVIGMDACLMAHIEVLSALAPHGRYFVGSQETEPSVGWAYAAMLQQLNANPDMTGGDLGKVIVDSYIDDDQRILDDAARADLTGRGSVLGGMMSGPSAAAVAQQLSRDVTLSTIDLSGVPGLINSLNNLAFQMQSGDQRAVAQARSYAQSFTSIWGSNVPASYLDLGNFAQLLAKASTSSAVDAAASQLLSEIQRTVISEKHGSNKPGATGISVYFPNSKLYGTAEAGPRSYTVAAERFAKESLWDDFLAFHYLGRQFQAASTSVATTTASDTVSAPAAGGISVSALRLSKQTVAPGDTITLSVDIKGANLGYVKLLAGFIDTTARSIYVADTDYLQGSDTREVSGVFYPDWGSTDFTMTFDWEPIVYAVFDGTTLAEAAFTPITYGASAEETIYTVDGQYTFADGGEQRYARAYFRNGVLVGMYAFSSADGPTGSPRAVNTTAGDTFTVYERWMDLDASGKVSQTVLQPGKTLTFGDSPFTWQVLNAAAGNYIVGFIVEDLDGNQTPVYGQVTVQ